MRLIKKKLNNNPAENYYNLIECQYRIADSYFNSGDFPECISICREALNYDLDKKTKERQKEKLSKIKEFLEKSLKITGRKWTPHYPNPFYKFNAHACDEYLANEHEYEIILDECARENVVLKMFQNARVNDAYPCDCVNVYELLLYEDGDVNVFHWLLATLLIS